MSGRALCGSSLAAIAMLIVGPACEPSKQGAGTQAADAKPAATQASAASQSTVARKAGDLAPAFDAQTVDGKKIEWADYEGKYLLLDFWATWCGPCVAEIPVLKQIWEKHGKDPRFALLSLSLDSTASEAARFAEQKDLRWTQGFLGRDKGWDVLERYGQEGIPSTFLVDPRGRIIAYDPHGEELLRAVDKALVQAAQ